MTRQQKRAIALIFIFIFSGFLIWLGLDDWTIRTMPVHYLGCIIAACGIAGLLGVNIWYGGPLDPRKDPEPGRLGLSPTDWAYMWRRLAIVSVPFVLAGFYGLVFEPDMWATALFLIIFFGACIVWALHMIKKEGPPAAQTTAPAAASFSLRLSTGKTVSLTEGAKLNATDITGLQASTGGSTVAEVGRNPNDPNILGLKNLSCTPWTATLANRTHVPVDPGRNVRIAAGTKISFGSVSADIEMT